MNIEDYTEEEIAKVRELNEYVKTLLDKYKAKTLSLEEAEFLRSHIEFLLELEAN